MKAIRFPGGATLGAVLLLGSVSCVCAQETVRDPLAVQHARATGLTTKGKKVAYTRTWDLSGLPAYAPEAKVSGTLRMWGSNYMADSNLAGYWESGIRRFQPDLSFEYHLKSAWVAIAGLDTGAADLAPCRKITFNELEGFQRVFDHDPLEIRMATGSFDVGGWNPAFAILVHKENPVHGLSMAQLDGIFGAARTGGWIGTEWHPEFARGADKNIRTWGQAGLTGEWADKRIHPYGLNLRYHQATEVADWILQGSDKWNEDLRVYANFAKPDGTLGRSLMDDLLKDAYGIAYVAAGTNGLPASMKVLPIAPKDGTDYVPLKIETVHDETYPLSDAVYFYANRAPGAPLDPKVKEYLRYVLSREGQEAVEKDGKYLPLRAEVAAENLKKLE